jgi:NAD(P)-dependent dehydrogenase (short-subunit alcohol dehydrogenase family)
MDLSRFSMEGRTVIITGGSSGLGLGCARIFASAGAKVANVSLPADSIPPAVAEVESLGVQALGLAVDVTDETQVDAMVRRVMERFGRIDTLVNVAGGTYSRNPEMPQFRRGPLLEIAPLDFMRTYEVNVKSAFLCARAVVPQMKAQGKGSIVNTGSVAGLTSRGSSGGYPAYGAAKAALHALTMYMAHEWGPEVRVNCIAPGTIDTPRPAGTSRPELANAAERIAVGRVGVPEDVANVALFLASDAASFVNAAVIPVDGGA